MLFSSISFLYFFLPLTLFLYFFVPQKGKNLVLLFMSVLFYAWGEPVYVLLMLAQIAVSFGLTGLMERYRGQRAAGIFYILSVLFPFLALFYFKYIAFFTDILFQVHIKTPALPIGISFYTFQIASYCIDVYHQRVPRQKNLITYAAYVTLFPQLVAGPIVRYREIEKTLTDGIDFSDIHMNFEKGIVRFVTGLGKKVLIANVLGAFVSEVAALGTRTVELSWAYAIAIALQIYFDFSGYSDMAIGLGELFGFQFPENFRHPFIAKSVREFWRRWHITLGAWFRDYVYIPMGGNRVGALRWMFNILVVWLFTGLWHGAGWNFIVWGFLFAVLLVIEKGVRSICRKRIDSGHYVTDIVKHIYVAVVIIISFLIFHNDSLMDALSDIAALVNRGNRIAFDGATLQVCAYLLRNRMGILLIGLFGATPAPLWIWKRLKTSLEKHRFGDVTVHLLQAVFAVGILVLCTAYLIDGSFNPFLYFRF